MVQGPGRALILTRQIPAFKMDGPDFADKLREWEELIRLHDVVRPDQPVGDSVKVSVLMEQAPNSTKDS
eukprot:11377219-Alexandrium_andersonii.AAC.1